MFHVTALGELLVDFIPCGMSEGKNALFERNPGGAPANVLAALARLGSRVAMIGKVGDDPFGRFLAASLRERHVDTTGLRYSPKVPTTLAFVHLSPDGERSFTFYRSPGADATLESSEIDVNLINNAQVFHFGSLSLTGEPARSATNAALAIARKRGLIISYDPNLRPALWTSLEEAEREIKSGLEYADILKVSEDELKFITGEGDLFKGSAILAAQGISLVLVTLGAGGAFYRCGGRMGRLGAYEVDVVDTTGAGDAFVAGVLYKLKGLARLELTQLPTGRIEDMVDFANAMGAVTCKKRGGVSAMPSLGDVDMYRREVARIPETYPYPT